MKQLTVFVALLLVGCGFVPQKVAMDDPTHEFQPLLKAAASFDRTSYGFTPIPKTADVQLDSSRRVPVYAAVLHRCCQDCRERGPHVLPGASFRNPIQTTPITSSQYG
jgi:hypothetical protein